MRKMRYVLFAVGLTIVSAGCNNSAKAPEQQPAQATPAETSAPRIYVTNEVGGDLSIIDSGNDNVLATVPIGSGVDANAFDPGTQLAFASCGDGTTTIAGMRNSG